MVIPWAGTRPEPDRTGPERYQEWYHCESILDKPTYDRLRPHIEAEWEDRFASRKHDDMSVVPRYLADEATAHASGKIGVILAVFLPNDMQDMYRVFLDDRCLWLKPFNISKTVRHAKHSLRCMRNSPVSNVSAPKLAAEHLGSCQGCMMTPHI